MPEPTDYLRRWDFSEGSGTTVTSQTADADNLAIQGTGGAWVTNPTLPGLDAVGYHFARSGDGRAQTLITGSDLFGASEEYTVAVRAALNDDDQNSDLVMPTAATADTSAVGYLSPWGDDRIWAGHAVAGVYQEVSNSYDADGDPHWWVVTCTNNGDGTVTVRLYLDDHLVAFGSKIANADAVNVTRICVANIYNGGQSRGCDCTVYGLRVYSRALTAAEVPTLGEAPGGSNTAPVAVAGPDATWNEGAVVALDGSESADAETPAEDLIYTWTVTNAGGTSLVTGDLMDADQPMAMFHAPAVVVAATVTLQLQVSDGALSDTDSVAITIDPMPPGDEHFPHAGLHASVELLLGGVWVDLTTISGGSRVVSPTQGPKVTITRGRRDWSEDPTPAECSMTLYNPDGLFSARNPLSPYYGLLGRNVQLRVVVHHANDYIRFWGEVASWPQTWEPTETLVQVPIKAYGILHRLGQWNDPIQSVLRHQIPLLLSDLVGYWPLTDRGVATTTRLSSGVEGGERMRIVGTTRPNFAAYDGFVASEPIPEVDNAEFRGDVNFYPVVSGQAALQFAFLMHVPEGGDTDNQTVVQCETSANASSWRLRYLTTGGGSISLRCFNDNGTSLLDTGALQGSLNGKDVWVVVQLAKRTSGASGINWDVYVFEPGGNPEGTTRSGTLTTSAGLGRADQILIDTGGGLTGVAVGHVTVQSRLQSPEVLVEALAGYAGEPAGRRIERNCLEHDIPFTSVGDLDDTESMGPQSVGTFLEIVQEAARTDLGMLYEARDMFALGYRTRLTLYDQPAQIAMTYGAGQLHEFEPIEDDQDIRNDITVQNPDGNSARRILRSGPLSVLPPPDGIGRIPDTFDVNVVEGRLDSHAAWRLLLRTVDEARYPTIAVELANPQIDEMQMHAMTEADVGDRLTVDTLPVWLSPEVASQLIQGYEEELYLYRHLLRWNCTPESPYRAALVGDVAAVTAATPRAGTSGSETAASFNAGVATSLSVATTTGPLWTTKAASFPFHIRVGGVVLNVTNITGAASPQTFTVTAAPVNGVTKTIPAGSAVQVEPLPRVRL
jgi:hypothetical protein